MESLEYITTDLFVSEDSVVLEVDPTAQMELICLGFRGDEKYIRITRFIEKMHIDSIDIRIWYMDGTTESWTCGVIQSRITPLQHTITKQIQRAAKHYSGLTFEPFKQV